MHRIDAAGNAGGLFTEGNPGTGVRATKVDDDWLNAVQEEIVNVVTGAGIALVKGTNTQLRSAILSMIAGVAPVVGAASRPTGDSPYSASTGFTAPRAGYVVAIGRFIGTDAPGPIVQLTINSVPIITDSSGQLSVVEMGVAAVTKGQVVTSSLAVGTTTGASNALLLLFFIPAP